VSWRPPPPLAAAVAGAPLALLARTWRFDVRHGERWEALVAARDRFVFLLWHETLLPLLWRHRRQGIAIVVSESADGRYLAAYAARLGYRCLLGSSSRGGARVLLQAVRTVADGTPVAFTPDGPRGPRREIKSGALMAAHRAEARILPIVAVADRKWRLASWDRSQSPKPFARVRVGDGEPFSVSGGAAGLEHAAAQSAHSLQALEQELAWPRAAATGID
jgi:lysophospholipid acyltransferase (LPLAT)-like uncharacterized protein